LGSLGGAATENLVEPVDNAATMHDVAAAAGVSLKTVSRVVNGEMGVRQETAARVRAAIASLRFQPNAAARSLKTGRALRLVGLVIGDVTNPFYSGIARGVEEIAIEHGYLVITGSSDEHAAREHDLVTTLCRQHVAGLLVVPTGRRARSEREARIPTVFLDRPPPDGSGDAVLLDNWGGAQRGVAHLLACGHRRIGIVGDGQSVFTAGERLGGYRAALAEAAIPRDESLLALGAHDVPHAEASVHRLMEQPDPPTAMFAMNNLACVGVLRAVTDRKANVAVLGFDNLELAGILAPLHALIIHDPIAMGQVAARLVFARLAGDTSPWQTIVLPTTLVPYDRAAVRT
jgi:LacI family transcriptional regulator